jgi:hypothetical protein
VSVLTPRRQRIAFTTIVSVGTVLGLALGVREALIDPVLEVGEPRVRVEGTVATVQLTVRNSSDDTAYCPEVGMAAVDREGLDLDSGVAVPDLTDGRLGPGQSANYIGTLTGMDQNDFDEELDEYVGFIEEENPCP